MLKLSQHQKLLMKLTPQQVQYLKLLQLPLLSLEQRIKAELEINPLLEEGEDADLVQEATPEEPEAETPEVETVEAQQVEVKEAKEDKYSIEDFMNDELVGYKAAESPKDDDDEREEMPIAADVALYQKLRDQVGMLTFDEEENLIAEEIIGNIDEDGYLRRPLENIIDDINLSHHTQIGKEKAENVLFQIQRLDPPGIGARNLQECLIAQLEVSDFDEELKELALKMLKNFFEDFTMKHFEDLAKNLNITIEQLKHVNELIHKLNPKPGEGQFTPQQNYVVPDFIVEHDDDDLIVTLNERNIPPLRINKNYKEMMSRRKKNTVSVETKDFIRKRFEAAKWFITSIYQRRETMLNVMRTIIEKQREFFDTGENLKPMIYKDIASVIGMDISTISRVVNGKYVQTEYGTFELRYFFSDKIATSSGEDMSNKEVRNKIKILIESEPPDKPYSDDKIAEILNKDGMFVARRTVAKYREQLRIPIARLRRKI
jgi:RNA polymerase sigma-54 factor